MCVCTHSLVVDHIGCSVSVKLLFFPACRLQCTFNCLNWSGFLVFIMWL